MPTPSVGVEIVHEVAAAGDQHGLLAERRKLSANLKMVGRGFGLVDAELDDGNVGLSITVAVFRSDELSERRLDERVSNLTMRSRRRAVCVAGRV